MQSSSFQTGDAPTIRIEAVGGDLQVKGVDGTTVLLRSEGHNANSMSVQQSGNEATIRPTSGGLELRVPRGATVIVHRVGGDAEVDGVALLEAASVGGDLEVRDVRQVRIDAVGGDAELRLDDAQATIGRVGGDLEVSNADQLTIGIVGGDAELREIGTLAGLEKVGGDLELEWSGRCRGEINSKVGGDAEIQLGAEADVQLVAHMRGDVEGSGDGWQVEGTNGSLTATWGAGSGVLKLQVGGDLELHGGAAKDVVFTPREDGSRGPWSGFGPDMHGFGRNFGREMEGLARDLARELGRIGPEIQREVMRGFNQPDDRRPGRPGRPRVHVRVNNRDFDFDPEQVERIKREAQQAAANGIARAQEAVMRAFGNMGMHNPPTPPAPPAPPRPYTGQTVRIERSDAQAPSEAAAPAPQNNGDQTRTEAQSTPDIANAPTNPDEERLAILRMVAAGQIKPTEAEVLLRSLERAA